MTEPPEAWWGTCGGAGNEFGCRGHGEVFVDPPSCLTD